MNWIQCVDLSGSGFAVLWILPVLWTLFTYGYSAWTYQGVNLLHFGYCPYFGAASIVVKSLCISVYIHIVLLNNERITG